MGTGFARKKKESKLLRQKFEEMQDKLKEEQAVGVAGNGLVKVTLNGENEMVSIKIHPDCVDPEDVEGLEDLIRAAYTDAATQIEKRSSEKLGLF